MGRNHDPITLHKYLYGNVDPANMVDPTGNFSMTQMTVAQSLQANGILMATLIAPYMMQGAGSLEPKRATTKLSLELAKIKVRSCRLSADTNCKAGIPIIFYGADVKEHTDHVFDAQLFKRAPAVLSRTSAGGWGRSWYRNRPECWGRGRSQQCDEYPYNSSEQGGPRNNVSLRLINGIHNEGAGRKLNSFYSTCGVQANHDYKKWFGVIAAPKIATTTPVCARE